MREQALGDAIAAETGTDGPQQRLAAALLSSVHRVLSSEAASAAWRDSRGGDLAVLADAATRRSTCWSRPSAATASGPAAGVASRACGGPAVLAPGTASAGRACATAARDTPVSAAARDVPVSAPPRPAARRRSPACPAERCRTSTSRPATSPAIPPAADQPAWSPETEAACRAWPRAGRVAPGAAWRIALGLPPGQAAGQPCGSARPAGRSPPPRGWRTPSRAGRRQTRTRVGASCSPPRLPSRRGGPARRPWSRRRAWERPAPRRPGHGEAGHELRPARAAVDQRRTRSGPRAQ